LDTQNGAISAQNTQSALVLQYMILQCTFSI